MILCHILLVRRVCINTHTRVRVYFLERHETLYLPSYGLNSTITTQLQVCLRHLITHDVWYTTKMRNQNDIYIYIYNFLIVLHKIKSYDLSDCVLLSPERLLTTLLQIDQEGWLGTECYLYLYTFKWYFSPPAVLQALLHSSHFVLFTRLYIMAYFL